MPSWNVCGRITYNLRRLRTLKVSNNRWIILSNTPNDRQSFSNDLLNSLPSLQEIVIGKMEYDWNSVFLIASSLPRLSVLQAPSNNITEITGFGQPLCNLTELNLSKNPITDWSSVLALSPLLPNLNIMALNECLIQNIEFPTEQKS